MENVAFELKIVFQKIWMRISYKSTLGPVFAKYVAMSSDRIESIHNLWSLKLEHFSYYFPCEPNTGTIFIFSPAQGLFGLTDAPALIIMKLVVRKPAVENTK